MPDVEQRLATVERELASLKGRVGVIDEDMKNIPDLIKTEHRFTNNQITRIARDLDDVRGKVDALPRAVAEIVMDMLKQRDTE